MILDSNTRMPPEVMLRFPSLLPLRLYLPLREVPDIEMKEMTATEEEIAAVKRRDKKYKLRWTLISSMFLFFLWIPAILHIVLVFFCFYPSDF